MNRRRKINGWTAVIPLLLFISVVAWTQTKQIKPVQVKRNNPGVYYFKVTGKKPAMKEPASGGPSVPPALIRSERISVIALARKAGNIQAKSLTNEPRASIVLAPDDPVSGLNYFNLINGKLESGIGGNVVRTWATITNDRSSYFFFRFNVIPGKTYLADFKVESYVASPRWSISGTGIDAEIEQNGYHMFVAFTTDSDVQLLQLRLINQTFGTFYRCELTRID
jgi:hypothetical protein